MHILSMFLYSKLAFGSELKKEIPTSFPKIDKQLALISIFGFYSFLFLDFKIYYCFFLIYYCFFVLFMYLFFSVSFSFC